MSERDKDKIELPEISRALEERGLFPMGTLKEMAIKSWALEKLAEAGPLQVRWHNLRLDEIMAACLKEISTETFKDLYRPELQGLRLLQLGKKSFLRRPLVREFYLETISPSTVNQAEESLNDHNDQRGFLLWVAGKGIGFSQAGNKAETREELMGRLYAEDDEVRVVGLSNTIWDWSTKPEVTSSHPVIGALLYQSDRMCTPLLFFERRDGGKIPVAEAEGLMVPDLCYSPAFRDRVGEKLISVL